MDYAKRGTTITAVLTVFLWVFRDSLSGTDFAELPQVATAAFVLGLVGTAHVTRRARRITQRQQRPTQSHP